MSYRITFILVILALIVSQGFSQNVVRESFQYTATIDGLGDASNGWGGPWAADTSGGGVENLATIANHVFDFEDLNWVLPDTGNQLQVTRANPWADSRRYKRPLDKTWPNEAGKSYWISYMLDIKEPLPVQNTYFMVKLYNNSSELLAIGKAGGRAETDPPVFTCGSGWTGEGDDVSDYEIETGPIWLVVRIDMSGGSGADRTFMWVDPDPEEVPDTTSADVKRNSTMPDGFNYVAIEFGGDGATQMIFDEIKVAEDYSDLSTFEPTGELVMESFDYISTIDGLGTAGNGWAGAWAADTSGGGVENLVSIANHVFDFEDLNWVLPDTGNQLQITRANPWADSRRYKRPLAETWANEAGKSYWVSYMLDIKEPLPVQNTYFMVKLYNNSSELLAIGKAGGRAETDPPVFTCGSGWTGEGDDVSDYEIETGPIWLVVRIDMSGGSGADRTFMWVDPDPEEVPDTTNADVKRNSTMPDGFNTVAIEFGGDGATQMVFDEITVADSYAGLSTVVTALPGEHKNPVPNKLRLSQNYPNPFNPTTQITYTVENSGQVRLTVYDVSGREVATLADGYHNSGVYNVTFSGNELTSGVYFYQLYSADGIITRKMTLLK